MPAATAAAPQSRPWAQLPGEPDEAYARFLAYRNLGPARSIDAAAQSAEAMAAKRGKTQRAARAALPRASGQWFEDSARFRWVERASAWDVATLSAHGREAVVCYVAAVRGACLRLLEALETAKPQTWAEALSGLELLARLIDPRAVAELTKGAEVGAADPHATGPPAG